MAVGSEVEEAMLVHQIRRQIPLPEEVLLEAAAAVPLAEEAMLAPQTLLLYQQEAEEAEALLEQAEQQEAEAMLAPQIHLLCQPKAGQMAGALALGQEERIPQRPSLRLRVEVGVVTLGEAVLPEEEEARQQQFLGQIPQYLPVYPVLPEKVEEVAQEVPLAEKVVLAHQIRRQREAEGQQPFVFLSSLQQQSQ